MDEESKQILFLTGIDFEILTNSNGLMIPREQLLDDTKYKIVKQFVPELKKTFSCNGSISNDEKFGEVIALSGDQKENVYNFFIKEEIYKKECIIIKGV